MSNIIKNTEYLEWLKTLKEKVRNSQLKAAIAVNTALLEFYWDLGADIVEKQKNVTWGSGFLNQLSRDLIAEFPDMKGFSKRNLEQIRRWYLFYNSDSQIAKQPATQLFLVPWWHNVMIVSKCKTIAEALYYLQKTIENNWSRSVLTHQIESGLFKREGKAITNFSQTLPVPQSDLAIQIIKDPYTFDFLTLTENYNERDLEQNLVQHITKFLLELGTGFAYMGKQIPIQVGNRDFFLDLLFYHTRLHAHVVIELKTVEFEPEHAGKLNFYIKAVDEQLRKEGDNPTIGILLCKNKDKLVAEYALSDIHKPMGVSEYQLTQALPDEFKSSLPTIEDIEAELSGERTNDE
jgi:predicted nuclease of restriction endonuclease-like (RecB) superfamily